MKWFPVVPDDLRSTIQQVFITGQFELKSKPKPGSLSQPRYFNHVTQFTELRLLTIGSNTELSCYYCLSVCWFDNTCTLICAFVCLPLLSAELENFFKPNNKWMCSRANCIHHSDEVILVQQFRERQATYCSQRSPFVEWGIESHHYSQVFIFSV